MLLDLVNGGILGTWLSLGYQNCTTHLVWNEVSQIGQREKVQPFYRLGADSASRYRCECMAGNLRVLK